MVCKHIAHESGRETSSLSTIFSEGRGASVHRLMRTSPYIIKWYNRGPDLGVLEVTSMGLCGCNVTKERIDIKYAEVKLVSGAEHDGHEF